MTKSQKKIHLTQLHSLIKKLKTNLQLTIQETEEQKFRQVWFRPGLADLESSLEQSQETHQIFFRQWKMQNLTRTCK
jgi:hypothetical protein